MIKIEEAREYLTEYETDSANCFGYVITVDDAMEVITMLDSCNGCEYHPVNSNTPYELHCDGCKRNSQDNYKLHIEKDKK